MKDLPQAHRHADLREGLRGACAPFDSAYWQRIDEERGYPEEFVQMLTLGGWLSALIPQEYGGSGLGLCRGQRHHGGDQPQRRQCRLLPRPDVQHGHAAADLIRDPCLPDWVRNHKNLVGAEATRFDEVILFLLVRARAIRTR